ncbi:MAG: NAD(P)/FAD-dependent oxidoreductase, partial [Candidatus Latescibacterota bacterium]
NYDEVYAIGDASTAGAVKTGIGAHYQSLIVAQNLINELHGSDIKVSYMGELGCPFVESIYSPSTRGKAHIASWMYDKPLEPFKPTRLSWFIYRMYYYIYWDTELKALM